MSEVKTLPERQYNMPTAQKAKWREKKQFQKFVFLLLAVGPSMAGYFLFDLYPNVMSAYYSLFRWDGVSEKEFIGMDNFIRIFQDPQIIRAAWNNLIIMLVVPVSVIMISLLLAYALTNKDFAENRIYRNLFFIPNVLSTVIVALIFTFIFDGGFGLLNAILRAIGLDTGSIYWLGDERTALIAVMITMIWGSTGFYLIVFMNAMTAIPKSIYESCTLDGAGSMVRLFKITVPLIWGVIKVSMLFLMIGMLKGFEIIMVLTEGGPAGATNVLGLYMFNLAFGSIASGTGVHKYGYASAIGMLLFAILVILKLIVDKFANKDPVEF